MPAVTAGMHTTPVTGCIRDAGRLVAAFAHLAIEGGNLGNDIHERSGVRTRTANATAAATGRRRGER